MNITVKSVGFPLTEANQNYVSEKFSRISGDFDFVSSEIKLSLDNHLFVCDIHFHQSTRPIIHISKNSDSFHGAVDAAFHVLHEKLSKEKAQDLNRRRQPH